jgi:large subunit ribosomal protein L17
MRHNRSGRKLGRVSEHRRALFRNQLCSLVKHERIITTLPKAKELRPIAERVVTLARQHESVHAHRMVARWISDRGLVRRLFSEIAPRFAKRPGGYTRILKLGPRPGDGAELAILEFVDYRIPEAKGKAEAKEKKAKSKKKARAEEPAGATAEE